MKITNEFTISAAIEDAWDVLTDLEQVIPLMPGAQMTGRDGDDVLGKVKVKVGPVTSEFSGKVRFVEQNRDAHRAVIDGKGKEARGTGNASPLNCTTRVIAPASPSTPISRLSASSPSSAAVCCNRFRRNCWANSSNR
jgi:carbon monoxide dehydrogenase subunit G